MKILIQKEFRDDFTTRVAGERLREMIIGTDEKITLDFKNLKVASASFFDEGLAKLSEEGWDSKKAKTQLKFKNMFDRDKELLRSVCSSRGLELGKF